MKPPSERIKTATLMIIGSESTTVSQNVQKRMKRFLSDIEIVTVEGATHMVPQDKPVEFEGLLRRFLERIK